MIRFAFIISGVEQSFSLEKPNGTAGTNYYVMKGNRYCGTFNKMSDGWHFYLNSIALSEFSAQEYQDFEMVVREHGIDPAHPLLTNDEG